MVLKFLVSILLQKTINLLSVNLLVLYCNTINVQWKRRQFIIITQSSYGNCNCWFHEGKSLQHKKDTNVWILMHCEDINVHSDCRASHCAYIYQCHLFYWCICCGSCNQTQGQDNNNSSLVQWTVVEAIHLLFDRVVEGKVTVSSKAQRK